MRPVSPTPDELVRQGRLASAFWLLACIVFIGLAFHALFTWFAIWVLIVTVGAFGIEAVTTVFRTLPDFADMLAYTKQVSDGQMREYNTMNLLVRKHLTLALVLTATMVLTLFTFAMYAVAVMPPRKIEPDEAGLAVSPLVEMQADLRAHVPRVRNIVFALSTAIVGRTLYLSMSDVVLYLKGRHNLLHFKLAHEMYHAVIWDPYVSTLQRHLTALAGYLTGAAIGVVSARYTTGAPDAFLLVAAAVTVIAGHWLGRSLRTAFQMNKELHADGFASGAAPLGDTALSELRLRDSQFHPPEEDRTRYIEGGRSAHAGRAFALLSACFGFLLIFKQFVVDQFVGEAFPREHLIEVVAIYVFTILLVGYLAAAVRPALRTSDMVVAGTALAAVAALTLSQFLGGVQWHFGPRPAWYYSYSFANYAWCLVSIGALTWAWTRRRVQ